MSMLELDHLAISAQTLKEGRAKVEDILGVALQDGGAHDYFGTHNLLLGLEDGLYLEVIAIDPAAPAPKCPRWFDLDRFEGSPRLTNWICRTNNLHNTLARHPAAGDSIGLERGDLKWKMAVPNDGRLPYDGVFPAVIEWQGKAHPAARLEARGCRLARLVISHPSAKELAHELEFTRDDQRVVFETGAAGLRAEFETLDGVRVLA